MYSFDTSVFIDLGRYYPRTKNKINQKLWNIIEDYLKKGIVLVSEEVLEELKRKDDGIYDWLKNFKSAIIPSNESNSGLCGRNCKYISWMDSEWFKKYNMGRPFCNCYCYG